MKVVTLSGASMILAGSLSTQADVAACPEIRQANVDTSMVGMQTKNTLVCATGRAHSRPVVPGLDLQALAKAFSGHWRLQVHFEPSRHAPNGIEGVGEEAGGPGGTHSD